MFFQYPKYYTIPMADDDLKQVFVNYNVENEADCDVISKSDIYEIIDEEYVQEVTKKEL